MSKEIYNTRIESEELIPTPEELRQQVPNNSDAEDNIFKYREEISSILAKKDKRLIAVIGPCSIHNVESALEYAEKLNDLRKEVEDKFLVIMRVYFEKPRTTGGWKGFIYDPELNDSFNISKGLVQSRALLKEINSMGMATATECLDPVVPEYIGDLISWIAIGARTTESQIHRQLASGLSIPVGFKNSTAGNYMVALNAMKFSANRQGFFGIGHDGRVKALLTKGNKDTMLILRGGNQGPNFDYKIVQEAGSEMLKLGLKDNIVIDCSHANSYKNHNRQPEVLENVIQQVIDGSHSICGFMLESNLYAGNQELSNDLGQLKYGVSITDKCLSFERTQEIILKAHKRLSDG